MSDAAPSAPIEPSVRRFLEAPGHFAVVATLDPDGSVHHAVAWYLLRDGTLVLNSREGRRWPGNLLRDPRVSVAVEDGYRWVTLRGTVEVIDDQARAQADIAEMARRYHADDPAHAEEQVRMFREQRRVTFELAPARVAASVED